MLDRLRDDPVTVTLKSEESPEVACPFLSRIEMLHSTIPSGSTRNEEPEPVPVHDSVENVLGTP